MKKRIVLVGILSLFLALSTAYAVQLTLNPDSVSRAGGTGIVSVSSPEFDGTINSANFTAGCVDTTCGITGVNIVWDPAETGNYTIIVILYDSLSNVLATASVSTTVGTLGTTTTTLTFNQPVNPKDVYGIEVMIVQTTS